MTNKNEVRILVVDDEPLNLEIIMHSLNKQEYNVKCTADAEQALMELQNNKEDYDVILLDRQLPGMDGLEFLKRIKKIERFKYIPVIMQTALGRESERKEGVEAGAYYYLSKPYDSKSLLDIVEKAANDIKSEQSRFEDLRKSTIIEDLIENCTLRVRNLDDVERATQYLANLFPDAENVSYGIHQLLLNAVEHGNLGIGYQAKEGFADDKAWEEEVNSRLGKEENKDKFVTVNYTNSGGEISLTVEDQGEGFDWEPYLTIDTNRAEKNHGRGIAIANMRSFDSLEYTAPGNKVTAKVKTA